MGETPIKWSTFGCLVYRVSGEELWSKELDLVHHFLTKTCSCQATLKSTNEKVSLIGLSKTYTYIFSTTSFIVFDLDRSSSGSAMSRVNSIPSAFINFFLREDIPGSILGDGGSVILKDSLKWGVRCRNIPHRHLQQYPVEFDRNLRHIRTSDVSQLRWFLTLNFLDNQIMGSVKSTIVHNEIICIIKNWTTVEA